MPILKTADASTLTVATQLKNNMDDMRSVLPKDCKLELEFDQSPYVTGAVGGVEQQSAIGAVLTGLMVLLFLRDWRSVIVVVLTIPLSLMGALIGLFITGQTINLMTLGGLSLAIGIIEGTAIVVIENIHTQLGKAQSVPQAVLVGTAETMVPILLSILCILAVFLPSFLMEGAAGSLFVPLAISVGFAMITAFVLSITFVPVLSIWILKPHAEATIAAEQAVLLRRIPAGSTPRSCVPCWRRAGWSWAATSAGGGGGSRGVRARSWDRRFLRRWTPASSRCVSRPRWEPGWKSPKT